MSEIDRFGVQGLGLPPEVAAYVADHADKLLRAMVRDAVADSVRVTQAGVAVDWQIVLETLHRRQRQPEAIYDGEDDRPPVMPYGLKIPNVLAAGLPVMRRYPMSARNAAETDLNSAA